MKPGAKLARLVAELVLGQRQSIPLANGREIVVRRARRPKRRRERRVRVSGFSRG